jgi:hypothetical protein
MTSLQDSFSSISQLADSVAMPENLPGSAETTDKEAALRLGLERVRLMILAEEDRDRIKSVWAECETEDVTTEALIQEIQELKAKIDQLPGEASSIETPA